MITKQMMQSISAQLLILEFTEEHLTHENLICNYKINAKMV